MMLERRPSLLSALLLALYVSGSAAQNGASGYRILGSGVMPEASASEDGPDPERGFLGRLRGPLGAAYALAFSAGSDMVAAGARDTHGVYLWNLSTSSGILGHRMPPVRHFAGHRAGVTSLAFAPRAGARGYLNISDRDLTDGVLITGAADNTTRIWDHLTGRELVQLPHPKTVFGIAVRPSGSGKHEGSGAVEREFATASWDGVLRLFEWPTGAPRAALEGHTAGLYDVAYSPLDGALLATASADRTVRIWDCALLESLWTLKGHRDHVTSVDWSPKEVYVLATGSWDRTFRLWEAAAGEQEVADACRRRRDDNDQHPACPRAPSAPRSQGKHPHLVFGVAFAPGGDLVAACHGALGQNPTVVIYDAATGRVVRRLGRHRDTPLAVAWSPNGAMLASTGMDRTVLIYEALREQDDVPANDDDAEERIAWLKDLEELRAKRTGAEVDANATENATEVPNGTLSWVSRTPYFPPTGNGPNQAYI